MPPCGDGARRAAEPRGRTSAVGRSWKARRASLGGDHPPGEADQGLSLCAKLLQQRVLVEGDRWAPLSPEHTRELSCDFLHVAIQQHGERSCVQTEMPPREGKDRKEDRGGGGERERERETSLLPCERRSLLISLLIFVNRD